MSSFELYGAAGCPYTQQARDWLEWNGHDYVEYDVEAEEEPRRRMLALTGGQRTVPVLVQDGKVIQIGWQGRGCAVSAE